MSKFIKCMDATKPNINMFEHTNPFIDPNQNINNLEDYYDKININIKTKITNLSELIDVIQKHPASENVVYNIDMQRLRKILPQLVELNNMIGLQDLKKRVLQQIKYFIQDLHKSETGTMQEYLNTVICGSPGTGKTEIAMLLGQIYAKIGILRNEKFVKATRADFVAGYVGQTAMKTRDLVHNCLGGVLFIDEAYSFGNEGKSDCFSKEAIDTLCELMSFYMGDLMVILAGYKNELKLNTFSINKGLESRFAWNFEIDKYTPSELKDIFINKVLKYKWTIDTNINLEKWFEKNYENFPYFGRDVENLFTKIRIVHGDRIFLSTGPKKCINEVDLEEGFKMYKMNIEDKKTQIPMGLYI